MPPLSQLLDRYELFLLDAFGVLVHSGGALAGARELLDAITSAGKQYVVVTNDASRLPESSAQRYRSLGLPIDDASVASSGMLLVDHFREHNLIGASCLVLGTKDSEEYIRRAGGRVAEHRDDGNYDAVISCDDAGYPFLDTLDVTITALFRLFDSGRRPALVLPNPDIIYPKSEDSYGFTAGGAAMLLEEALRRRYPDAPPRFARLGKPQPTLFHMALGDLDPSRALVIGDQLETDIAGAHAAGIDAMLVESGVSGRATSNATGITPKWRIGGLADLVERGD